MIIFLSLNELCTETKPSYSLSCLLKSFFSDSQQKTPKSPLVIRHSCHSLYTVEYLLFDSFESRYPVVCSF